MISLLRARANRALWRQAAILKLSAAVCLVYLLWYGWIIAYSYRWYLQRLPMSRYEYCGTINTDFPTPSGLEAWIAKENAARSSFYKAYQRCSAARLASIGHPEEYGPYTSWLIVEKAERPVRKMTYIDDSFGSTRFRDFLFKGWTLEYTAEIAEMRLLTYAELKNLRDREQNLRAGEPGDRYLIHAIGFYHRITDQLYLAVYPNESAGKTIEIY